MYQDNYTAAFDYEAAQTVRSDSFVIDHCTDTTVCELEGVEMEHRGRIVELSVRLHNVCPGKRTALGVLLHETDGNGQTEPRGMKTLTVPAHSEGHPCDVMVRRIRFVLPEDLRLCPDSEARRFLVHTTAHYIDVDSSCLCALPPRP